MTDPAETLASLSARITGERELREEQIGGLKDQIRLALEAKNSNAGFWIGAAGLLIGFGGILAALLSVIPHGAKP